LNDYTPQPSILERFILWGIIGLLIFAPLAFGSVHLWAYTVVEIGVFSLLFLQLMNRILFSGYMGLHWIKTPVNGLLIIFIILICFQMIPLPSPLIALISPRTFADKIQFLNVIDHEGEYFQWMTLAYYIHPAIRELLKLLAYIGIFFLTLNTVKSKKEIDTLICILIFLGLFQIIYAMTFQCFATRPVIWWWEKSWRGVKEASNFHAASGTFIGSNHFAFYMEMLFSLSFGFMVAQKKSKKRFHSPENGFHSLTQRIVKLFSPESSAPKMIFIFLCSVFIGTGLLFSGSRGGILSIGIAMSFMSFLFFFKKNYRRYGLIIAGLFMIILIYAGHTGIQPLIEKFRDTRGLYMRLYTTGTIFPMIKDYPLLGVGWGNFAHIYSRYVPKDTPEGFEGTSTSGYSHNDWVEASAEVGLAGGLLMLILFFGYLVYIIRVWFRRNDYYALGIGSGIIVLLISAGIHSFFDFSMHISANPLTLGAISGLGYAAVHYKRHGYGESFSYEVREIPLTPIKRLIIAGLVFSFLMLLIIGAMRHFMAEIKCATEWNSTLKLNWNPDKTEIQKAISLNPLNAEYYFKLAKYNMRRRYRSKDTLKEFNDEAIINLEDGLNLNPAQGYQWNNLGESYALKHHYDTEDNLRDHWLPLADKSFDISIQFTPNETYMYSKAAEHWVWRSTFLPEAKDVSEIKSGESLFSREDGIRKFQSLYQKVLEAEPDKWKGAVEQIRKYYSDPDIIAGIVPADDVKLKPLILQWLKQKTEEKIN